MNDKAAPPSRECHDFQAEVSKLLHLMVHSVYSQKEVFLRELVSNASDACDKLRYLAITEPALTTGACEFKIAIGVDKKTRLITVADNGIGMDRQELIDNLGTIAHSGTGDFVARMSGDSAKDARLIGQFGVGFYSAFMVADRVTVTSRRAGAAEIWRWTSDGAGTFEVEPVTAEDAALLDHRGTTVALHVRKGDDEFLDADRLETTVKSYSDHIAIPIFIAADGDTGVRQAVNTASALWMRPKSEIGDDQYKEFYHHVGHIFDEPLLRIHYRAEGRHEYTVLLFVPATRPMDLFDPRRATRVKLYVRRVFITDDATLLPGYLRFLRGVVDSEDMPLNLSREMLQHNPIVHNIRTALTKRVLGELKKLADKKVTDYDKFWQLFGAVLKEGIYEDADRRESLLELARFRSTASDGWRSLKDYVAAMPAGQDAIYFLHSEAEDAVVTSPQLEGYRARGLEVLLLTDPVDAFWTSVAGAFDGKPLRSVARGVADLDKFAKTAAESADQAAPAPADDGALATLIALMKQTLGAAVADVRRSARLTQSAVCLVGAEGALDPYLERVLRQAQGDGEALDPLRAHVLEINPDHLLIRALADKAKAKGVTPELEDAAHLLLDQARIQEGATVLDRAAYARRLAAAISRGLA